MPKSASVTIEKQPGCVDIVVIKNTYATARISLFGGHVLSYVPKYDGRERLWLSDATLLDGSKPIRGGIPVCWPWFGDHPQDAQLPSHGFVRNQQWNLLSATDSQEGTLLLLEPNTERGDGFDGTAQLKLKVMVGQQLYVNLITRNTGAEPFSFCAALHSYFPVEDIEKTLLTGIAGDYKDKTQDYAIFDTPLPYRISEETDRVHIDPSELVTIDDEKHISHVHSTGHDSLVVWNPWQDKSKAMTDMTDHGYQSMICVETAVTKGITLAAGETHELVQVIQ